MSMNVTDLITNVHLIRNVSIMLEGMRVVPKDTQVAIVKQVCIKSITIRQLFRFKSVQFTLFVLFSNIFI